MQEIQTEATIGMFGGTEMIQNNPTTQQTKIYQAVEQYRKSTFWQLAALGQMVACLPLVQQVRGSIPGGEFENFQPRG